MTTFSDLIENVFTRTIGPVQERFVQVNEEDGVGLDDDTITFTGPQSNSVLPGTKISIDLENMIVLGVASGVATVLRGAGGSTPATHANGALIYINSTITRFDIGVAINDDLNDLSGQGLFRVGTAKVNWIPTFQGYDLGSLPANYMHILGVEYRTISPQRRFPAITEFDVRRWNPQFADPEFPSGLGLILYQEADPGQPMYVTYSAPLIPLVALDDSVTMTPSANDPQPPVNGYANDTTPNLPQTATDIPPLGATAALIQPQEISRNDMGSQPDPRKAAEVPAQAVASSTNAMLLRRAARISAEADRLYVQYPNRR